MEQDLTKSKVPELQRNLNLEGSFGHAKLARPTTGLSAKTDDFNCDINDRMAETMDRIKEENEREEKVK